MRWGRLFLRGLGPAPWPALLAVTVCGWGLLLICEFSTVSERICSASGFRSGDSGLIWATWSLMLLAMMPPLLAPGLRRVWVSSLTRKRWRAIVAFVMAYAVVWFAAGAALFPLAIWLQTVSGVRTGGALIFAIAAALIWQVSPAKQVCLNRCHGRPRLSAFGLAADLDAARYGVMTGFWCLGACWALMLAPLVAGSGHLLLMAAAAVLITFERQLPARPARWRLPSLHAAIRVWVLHAAPRAAP